MARSATRKTTSMTALGALLLMAVSFGTGTADLPCNIGQGSPDLEVVYFDLIPQTCPNPFQLSPPPTPLQRPGHHRCQAIRFLGRSQTDDRSHTPDPGRRRAPRETGPMATP